MANTDQGVELGKMRFQRQLARGLKDLLDSSPLRTLTNVITSLQVPAVIFGGAARDLGFLGYPPRDIDIVVETDSVRGLMPSLEPFFLRRTRFGGFCFLIQGWILDIWSLDETWAFRAGIVSPVSFDALPKTTFLNVEAFAVDLIPQINGRRSFFENSFFEAIATQVVEINLEENPFPDLCVVRSLLTAARLDFAIGSRLKKYIKEKGQSLRPRDIEEIQRSHYGEVKWHSNEVANWLAFVCQRDVHDEPMRLPLSDDRIRSLREKWAGSAIYLKNLHRSAKA